MAYSALCSERRNLCATRHGHLQSREGYLPPSLRGSVKETKQLRLSWKGVLALIVGGLFTSFLFDRFGRFDLASPTLFSALVIGIAVTIKWKLRRHPWFWITVTTVVALHILLILLVPWTTRWIPALVVTPFCIVDLIVVLAIFKCVERLVGRISGSDETFSS